MSLIGYRIPNTYGRCYPPKAGQKNPSPNFRKNAPSWSRAELIANYGKRGLRKMFGLRNKSGIRLVEFNIASIPKIRYSRIPRRLTFGVPTLDNGIPGVLVFCAPDFPPCRRNSIFLFFLALGGLDVTSYPMRFSVAKMVYGKDSDFRNLVIPGIWYLYVMGRREIQYQLR